MTASSKGAVDKPGKKIKQKSGLNRVILDVGWGSFAIALKYKLEERGGELIKVMPAFTSQECLVCGFTDAGNRTTQASFCCLKCRHTENADLNSAKVIKRHGSDASKIKQKKPTVKLRTGRSRK